MPPTRRQKRWSRPLRTAGALLLLLGAVALGDGLLAGAAPGPAVYAGAGFLASGAVCFWLGRRWS